MGPETRPLTCPYEELANGLHAMAQPLTVLRGALGAGKLRGSGAPENDRYIEMSVKQVERMGDLLSSLRDLLDTADGERKRAKINIGELISLVLEEMSSVFREWGGTIDRVEPDDTTHIHGDADRTERALRAALRLAVSISSPGGVIRVSARACDGQVEVKVEQTARHAKNLGFAERLNLSLVERNIRSQGGRYECVEEPLCILLTLPAFSLEATDPMSALQFAPANLSS